MVRVEYLMKKTMETFYFDAQAPCALQWHQSGLDGVSNHQPRECLLSRLIRRRSKKTSKLRVTGLCAGNSPETGEFPAQRASNAENVSIWWRHHASSGHWHGIENLGHTCELLSSLRQDSPPAPTQCGEMKQTNMFYIAELRSTKVNIWGIFAYTSA